MQRFVAIDEETAEQLKTIPLPSRNVTQLVLGLELMLKNLPTHRRTAPEVAKSIGQNYDQHLAELRRKGYEKIAHYYDVQIRAYSHSFL